MSTLYSVSFLALEESTDVTPVGVPAGETWVIRDIDVYWGNQIEAPTGRILGSAGQAFAIWQGAVLAPNVMSWRGRHVITGPGTLTASVDVGNADISISGYRLTAP